MAVRVQSLVNYAVTLTNPAYTFKPFETKIFPDISIITSNLAAEDAAATLTAEVLPNIDEYDSSGYAKVSKRARKLQMQLNPAVILDSLLLIQGPLHLLALPTVFI